MSRNSGLYRFARLQLELLMSPIAAILIPLLLLIVLLMLPAPNSDASAKATAVAIVDPEIPPVLDIPDAADEPIEHELVPDVVNDLQNPISEIETPSPVINDAPLSPKPSEINAVSMTRSPIIMRGILGSTRDSGSRGQALQAYGGDAATEGSVMRALRWLKSVQAKDGGWDGNFMGPAVSPATRPNATGFVLLAFLSHGEVPGGSPEFGETVERGLKYLMAQKDPGYLGAYALVEAYGMTLNPVLKEAADNALKPWISKFAKGGAPDVISGAFMAMALHAAKLGDIESPDLDAMRLNIENDYREKGGKIVESSGHSSWHMTFCAVGLQYLGKHSDPVVGKVVEKLLKFWPPPTLEKSSLACCPVRANYFVTMMYFNMGGSVWEKWNKEMKSVYVAGQVVESGKYVDHEGRPQDIGYWFYDDSAGGKEHAGSQPLISTCYIVQQLMVYYRYLPTYQKTPAAVALADTAKGTDEEDVPLNITW